MSTSDRLCRISKSSRWGLRREFFDDPTGRSVNIQRCKRRKKLQAVWVRGFDVLDCNLGKALISAHE